MSLTKLSLVIAFYILFLLSCNSTTKSEDSSININNELMKDKLGNKPAIFFSCVRCGCMVSELNEIYKKDSIFFDKFIFYADTSCINEISFKKKIIHSPQSFLDSIYDENYSVILFKRNGNHIDTRLIKTDEAEKMKSILSEY
jgi:hypothetical protein